MADPIDLDEIEALARRATQDFGAMITADFSPPEKWAKNHHEMRGLILALVEHCRAQEEEIRRIRTLGLKAMLDKEERIERLEAVRDAAVRVLLDVGDDGVAEKDDVAVLALRVALAAEAEGGK